MSLLANQLYNVLISIYSSAFSILVPRAHILSIQLMHNLLYNAIYRSPRDTDTFLIYTYA